MAKKSTRSAKLKSRLDDLRGALSSGFERLVQHELEGLKAHYEELRKSLQATRKSGSLKNAAQLQLDTVQDTLDRLLV